MSGAYAQSEPVSIEAAFLLDHNGRIRYLAPRLLFVPDGSAEQSPARSPSPALLSGQRYEFRQNRYREAMASYRQAFADAPDRTAEAQALSALARVQKKSDRLRDARTSYATLAQDYGNVRIGMLPAELTARLELGILSLTMGDSASATDALLGLYDDLVRGTWTLERSQYTFIAQELQDRINTILIRNGAAEAQEARFESLKSERSKREEISARLLAFQEDAAAVLRARISRRTEGASKRDLFLWDLHKKCEIPLVSHPANDKLLGWTPDVSQVLFASDRAGSRDAWLLRVADGKWQGFPQLVKHSLGDVTPIGFTPSGSYYYAYGRMLNDVFTARLDLGTGEVLSEPVPVRQTGATTCHDWSPDGRYLAYCTRSPDESQTVHIRTLATGQERALADNLPYVRWLRWSLDGRSILIDGFKQEDSSGVIYKLDTRTGEQTDLVRSETEVLIRPEMSPDGKTLFFDRVDPRSKSTRLMAKNLETGLEKELTRIDPPDRLTGSALSPDGQRLVLSITPSQGGADGPVMKIISTAGGPPRELLHFEESEIAGVLGVAWMPDSRDVLFCKHLGAGKEHELWRISAKGGEPRRLWSRKTIGHLRVHPDGQHIAFYDRSTPHGVWVLESFVPGTTGGNSR